MQGWISIHRSIMKHWICKNAEYFKAWLLILLEVNHSQQKVLIKGTLFDCKIGESLNCLDTWAKVFGGKWNKSSVRRFFILLENDLMIVTKSEQKTTRLTVCNYETYQNKRNTNETDMKRKRNTDETQMTLNNKVDNVVDNVINENKLKDFETFWNQYPKRDGERLNKKQAKDYWIKKITHYQPVLDAVKEYAKHIQKTQSYPPDAIRFLRNELWRDFLPEFDMSVLPQQVQDNLKGFGGGE